MVLSLSVSTKVVIACLKLMAIFSLQLLALAAWARNIHWQPESWHTGHYELKVRFNAQDHQYPTRLPYYRLKITGHPGQLLFACSDSLPERIEGLAVQVVHDQYQQLTLTSQQASLQFDSEKTCSLELLKKHPYHWHQTLLSDEPFLVWQEPDKQHHYSGNTQGLPGMPLGLSPQTRELLASVGYGGSGDDTPYKPPPFPPFLEPAGSSITLLPILRLPSLWNNREWRNILSGSQWWHWLMGQPDYASGITVQLRISGQSPIIFTISRAEFLSLNQDKQQTLPESLLDSQKLWQWLIKLLACKLNGREALINTLLESTATLPATTCLAESTQRSNAKIQRHFRFSPPRTS